LLHNAKQVALQLRVNAEYAADKRERARTLHMLKERCRVLKEAKARGVSAEELLAVLRQHVQECKAANHRAKCCRLQAGPISRPTTPTTPPRVFVCRQAPFSRPTASTTTQCVAVDWLQAGPIENTLFAMRYCAHALACSLRVINVRSALQQDTCITLNRLLSLPFNCC
jgi:hypothetical protein